MRRHHQTALDGKAGEDRRKWLRDYGGEACARGAALKKGRNEMPSPGNELHYEMISSFRRCIRSTFLCHIPCQRCMKMGNTAESVYGPPHVQAGD